MTPWMATVALVAEVAEPVTAAIFLVCGLFLLEVEARSPALDPGCRRLARGVGWAYVGVAAIIAALLLLGIVPWGVARSG
ncbi:hypothetical protein E1B22_10695 [Thermaerobacter sp. FW80]|uniref:hypothetical protein n=1 Tax=Thermaerobacter sp. FW80 TaxID=2546351 RepID=UPI0010758353|nr:hypothetical protein [Thermaerobacter sp. FW80]QBS38148.1 hypothetical protein E1B22_10695 [Thermaerobacter sp. FW80]